MRASVRIIGFVMSIIAFLALAREQVAMGGSPAPDSRTNPNQTLAIVLNRSNPTDNLSFAELRKIFLGERDHWPNGHRIAIVMLDYGQPERQTVLRVIYRMDEAGYQHFLLRGMFRGDVFIAPKTLVSPTVVRKFVFNAPGAIGYVRSRDVDASVKVVRIDGLLPEDKGYRLQIDERSATEGTE